MWNPLTICEIRFYLWTPLTFADSTYILRIPFTFRGIHLPLWNPEQLAIFACYGIRKKTKCADKIYVTGICTGNLLIFC